MNPYRTAPESAAASKEARVWPLVVLAIATGFFSPIVLSLGSASGIMGNVFGVVGFTACVTIQAAANMAMLKRMNANRTLRSERALRLAGVE